MDKETLRRDQASRTAERSARWISRGLETLLQELGSRSTPKDDPDFDVVIVGSGYGGALAALKLAGARLGERPLRVCVLERGREYLAGMFPTSEGELPGHVRFNTPESIKARGRMDALLDLRIGNDVSALIGNGLGGGSLINAGVMLRPTDDVLQSSRWPQELRVADALRPYYDEAETLLSANGAAFRSYDDRAALAPQKLHALKRLHMAGASAAPLSIAIDGSTNHAGVALEECNRCGDCATGCNHRAKNSLDQNCLALAAQRGAQLFTGATVLRIARRTDRAGWVLHVVPTDQDLREQQGEPFPLTARRIVLAAGTYGSTEILMRSRSEQLRFSPSLGTRFSGNGDLLAAVYDQTQRVNAVAVETQAFAERKVGPSVTGVIDLRRERGVVLQEFAIPGALRRLFAECFTFAHTFHALGEPDHTSHNPPADNVDPCAVNPHAIERTQIIGMIADDGAGGSMELVPGSTAGEGAIRVRWPALREGAAGQVFNRQMATLQQLVSDSGQGGVVLPNPIWRLLPDSLRPIIDVPLGPALTVHPLGGCPMADEWALGVVDGIGRVFDLTADNDRHDDLVVLDGSIIPCALGINPSLTIAAVTLRAVKHLCRIWSLTDAEETRGVRGALPVFRQPPLAADKPAEIAVLERLAENIELNLDGEPRHFHVELTLHFEPAQLRALATDAKRSFAVDPSKSRIRLFEPQRWRELSRAGATEGVFDEAAEFIAPVSGRLEFLHRRSSQPLARRLSALYAYLCNRGLRDAWQRYITERAERKRLRTADFARGVAPPSNPWREMRTFWDAASHAGTVRLFDYDLRIGQPLGGQLPLAEARSRCAYADRLVGERIVGQKVLAYQREANLWQQLSQVRLSAFPGSARSTQPVLILDTSFYARQGLHLMQLVSQRDHATALFETASFVLTITRALILTHFWSFRKPDRPPTRVPQRLPGRIPGLPEPSIVELPVGFADDHCAVHIRLTRYGHRTGTHKPVVMIHGFSANGTSFTHPTLKPGLAKYLWESGRDVWVLDLRTSSGMPGRRYAWKFEDVARADIPIALDYIARTTGQRTDVVTQCMGAAMFSMALLDRHVGKLVRDCVDSVVLSQIGPTMTFSPENIFRAYVVSFVEQAIGNINFAMRPGEGLAASCWIVCCRRCSTRRTNSVSRIRSLPASARRMSVRGIAWMRGSARCSN
ncbi:GMC family oxidoreductase N-terminal domain-containing protein [Povalibacter sp.]|uniref:GMC family oxidoreductase N-terminal domain-containing protein n=1 Tax=Povalibacter sp. TaxID=1962978 RepID=UPI002F42D198